MKEIWFFLARKATHWHTKTYIQTLHNVLQHYIWRNAYMIMCKINGIRRHQELKMYYFSMSMNIYIYIYIWAGRRIRYLHAMFRFDQLRKSIELSTSKLLSAAPNRDSRNALLVLNVGNGWVAGGWQLRGVPLMSRKLSARSIKADRFSIALSFLVFSLWVV